MELEEALAVTATVAPTSGVVLSDYLSWEWEELAVSANRDQGLSPNQDRGRREFRFFLIRRDGERELAVGPVRSLRNMSYQCVLPIRSAIGLGVSVSKTFKRRKEVVDWLNSVIKGDTNEDGGIRGRKKQRPVVMHGSKENPPRYLMHDSKENAPHYLRSGSEVEVLSQEKRGCWFRACIVERSNGKAKVRYLDRKDALASKKLEECIPVFRIRPPRHEKIDGKVDVGTPVDAWWDCAWWEGVVVRMEPYDQLTLFHVYFPGEKQESDFIFTELRHSREWSKGRWICIRNIRKKEDGVTVQLPHSRVDEHVEEHHSNEAAEAAIYEDDDPGLFPQYDGVDGSDLPKDDSLARVLRKRTRGGGSSSLKVQFDNDCSSSPEMGICKRAKFLIGATLKVDQDNCCKFAVDSLFSSSFVPTPTSFVMSR